MIDILANHTHQNWDTIVHSYQLGESSLSNGEIASREKESKEDSVFFSKNTFLTFLGSLRKCKSYIR